MILFLGCIALGCALLYYGGNLLLEGAVAVGRSLGWSQAIIGLVLVSLGTSAPELFVSAGAAIQGFGDLAAGNVVGSNIVNISIVLGLGALIVPLIVEPSIRTQQIPIMVLLTVVSIIMLTDEFLSRIESALLLLATITGFTWTLLKHYKSESSNEEGKIESLSRQHLAMILIGIVLLVAGAEALIWGGVKLAGSIGVSQAVVGLTVTALGTSLPEIAATLVAVFRRQADLAVGNVVGSNILNLGLVLGFAGLVSPLRTGDIGVAPLVALFVLTLSVGIAAWKPGQFNRWMGVLLLLFYGSYTLFIVT